MKGCPVNRNAAKDGSISFRVCGESTLKQNYGHHLKRVLPIEDFIDLRPNQQKSMREWFQSSIRNKAAPDAIETDSITKKAQAILFQSSVDSHEILENERKF